MVLGSHNSWSYLSPMQWWLKPFKFIAKCQSVDIKTQYEKYGVRCFDLRLQSNDIGVVYCAHGIARYASLMDIMQDFKWLNEKKDCYVRVLHEARTKSQYNQDAIETFRSFCVLLQSKYQNIKFWCGRNLYNWEKDFTFINPDPSCKEMYSSVCAPKLIDDWWPWLYARLHNKKNIQSYMEIPADKASDILLIDFVNIR